MSASELYQGAPILDFLAPTDAKATALDQPAEGALDDPAAGREADFTGDGAFFDQWLTAFTLVFDVNDIASLLHKMMNIWKIIGSVCTQMLFVGRARDNNRDNQIVSRPLIMDVCPRNEHGQRRTSPVNQQMDFAAPFAAIHRAFARFGSAQGRWTRLAVNGLPLPLDMSLASVELHHLAHDRLKHSATLPVLKPLMQNAAAYPKPVAMNRLPLAACPQYVPDTIQHGPVVRPLASWLAILFNLRKQLPDPPPQRPWHVKVVHILRFCCGILGQGVFARLLFSPTQSERDTPSFSTPVLIYG